MKRGIKIIVHTHPRAHTYDLETDEKGGIPGRGAEVRSHEGRGFEEDE